MFFLNKRLVFMAGEAEKAISEVEARVKEKPNLYSGEKMNADELIKRAKDKLPTTLNEADKKTADDQINAARARFEAAIALAKRVTKFKTDVAAIVVGSDYADALAKVEALKAERDSLKEAGFADTLLDAKEKEVTGAAKGYYDGLITKIDKQPTAQDKKYTHDEITALMSAVSELQDAKYKNFPGLAKDTDTSVYATKVTEGLATIQANADSSTDPDFKESLRKFNFALVNLDGAEKSQNSKESGHLAGAKQYMEMVLAEQEARRIWNSLPFDADPKNSWRNSSIRDGKLDESLWKQANYENYTKAVDLFNKGMAKSVNATAGDSTKARDFFKQAADLWRQVAVEQQSKQKEKDTEKETKEKDTKDKTELNGSIDALSKAVGRAKGKSNDFYTKVIQKKSDEVMAIFNDEKKSAADKKKEMDAIIARMNTLCDEYDKAAGLILTSVNRAIAQNQKENRYLNDTKAKIISDYLRDPRLWSQMSPEVKTYFYNKRVSGTFYIGTDKYQYNISTTDPQYDGGVKDVDVPEGAYISQVPAYIDYVGAGTVLPESVDKDKKKIAEKKFKVDEAPSAVAGNDAKDKSKAS